MGDRYGFNPQCKIIAFTGDNPGNLMMVVMILIGPTLMMIFYFYSFFCRHEARERGYIGNIIRQ